MFKIINSRLTEIVDSSAIDLYQYKVFVGVHTILTSPRASYWYVEKDTVVATTGTGDVISSKHMCVEIFGYTPETRTSTFKRGTDLPYINGCSSKQLINPVRAGDPTFQMLLIPPHTSEQEHHIHSTARVVYVASGFGKSIVGTSTKFTVHDLNEGDVIILDKMTPHHFETSDSSLVVLPVHIYSSIESEEHNHPMFNGTHKI